MKPWLATLLLIGVTAVWGWTFVIVGSAVAVYGVMGFLAIRFLIAGVATAAVWGRHMTLRTLRTGAAIGLILAVGYLLQTWGLKYTTATNAGLITGLFVVLAPIIDRLIYGTKLHTSAWVAVGLSIIGMTLLTGRLPTQLALGDVLVFGCAFAFGTHIAVLSHHSTRHEPGALATAQMVGLAVIFVFLWPLTEEIVAPPKEVWFALALTGLVASALAYAIQTSAQRVLSTVKTAVVLTLEPVFAGLFGFLLAGERLGPSQFLGAALIFGAVLMSEFAPLIGGHLARKKALEPPGK
ncbi:MAG: EamA/RhaT family transporter [Acidobacteria bacterium]|nr:MAG: EamA/RhaT family transporter [Acidobacteriota bacterium]